MLVSLTPSPALAGSLCPYSENQWLNWTLVVQTGLACPPFSLAPKGSCLGSLAWAGARASVPPSGLDAAGQGAGSSPFPGIVRSCVVAEGCVPSCLW